MTGLFPFEWGRLNCISVVIVIAKEYHRIVDVCFIPHIVCQVKFTIADSGFNVQLG